MPRALSWIMLSSRSPCRTLVLVRRAGLFAFSALALACSGGQPSAPAESGDLPPLTDGGGSSNHCNPGQSRACHHELGVYNRVVLCFDGEQVCGDHDDWGPCQEKTN